MKKYECVIIFDESKLEGGGEAAAANISEFIASIGGKVESSESLGRKTFSYPIKKKNSGLYWDLIIELANDQVAALKENFRLDDSILRMEVLIFDRPAEPVTLSTRK